MTTIATVLLIISAFTHAGWNFISKKEYPTQAFYLVANTICVILVVSGCIILPLKALGDFHFSNYNNLCCMLAVFAAVGVAGYTVADDMALRYLRELPGQPMSPVEGTLLYMVLEGISCSIWQCLFIVVHRRERQILLNILKSHKSSAALTGIGIYITYGIVLVSMNYVSNVSYVAVFRQLSIPLGAIFGIVFLKEPRYLPKTIGITAIFLGLVLAGVK